MSAVRVAWHLHTRVFARGLAHRADAPPLLNEAVVRLRHVRLISESGEDYGEMPARTALQRAREADRDLMQVSTSRDGPAVVRLVDYAAWQSARQKRAYDERKKKKETKKLDRRAGAVKHVRLSPVIDEHDVGVKMRQAKGFLNDGYRVRVYMQFRKGQGRFQDSAKAALVRASEELQKFGKLQGVPSDGNIASMFEQEKENEEDEEYGAPVKKKPLQVVIFPLARKQREEGRTKPGLDEDVIDDVKT